MQCWGAAWRGLRVGALLGAVGVACVVGACGRGGANGGGAQGQGPNAPAPTPAPAAAVRDATRGQTVLGEMRAAWQSARAMSYVATIVDPASGATVLSAEVAMGRAESGAWRLRVQGQELPVGGAAARDLLMAFDTISARSVRADDKVVDERTTERIEDVRTFFTAQGAGGVVAWEGLGAAPFDAMRAVWIGEADVRGAACDVLELTPADAGDAPPAGTPVVVLSVGRVDRMPRRMLRTVVAEASEGAAKLAPARVLEIDDLRTGEQAKGGAFTLDVPSGFRVRAARPERVAGGGAGGSRGGAAPSQQWEHGRGLLAVGASAPEFALKDPSGKEHTLSSYRGRVLVMDFWATWCGPCRVAMPALQRLHDKYKDKPVSIVGFNAEGGGDGDPVAFKKQNNYTYGLLLKAEDVSERYRVQGLPTFYVVDAEGRIVWGGVGLRSAGGRQTKDYQDFLYETLSKLIDEQLKKMPAAAEDGA